MRLCRIIYWKSIKEDSFSTLILKLQDIYCKRQDIREDSNLFIIIKEAKDIADISRWEFEERIYIRISVTHRILHSIYFKKR